IRVGPGNPLNRLIENIGNRYRTADPILLEADRFGYYAEHGADQRPQRRHRPASLTAADLYQRVLLLLRGALVGDESHRHIAVAHRGTRSVDDDGEIESI